MRWLRYAFIVSALLIGVLVVTGLWWSAGRGVIESVVNLIINQQFISIKPRDNKQLPVHAGLLQTVPDKQNQLENTVSFSTDSGHKTIRVLVFECDGTAWSDVIEKNLSVCNDNYLIPGICFNTTRKFYTEEKKLTYADLKNFNVLIIPGGYLYKIYKNWRAADIRFWINNGGGYVGICAGEILAIDSEVRDSIFGSYNGLNLVPGIKHAITDWVGVRNVRMTRLGTTLLGLSGDQAMYLWNGSGFINNNESQQNKIGLNNGLLVFAVFFGNPLDQEKEDYGFDFWKSEFNGMAAIVGEPYGKGRIILSGPHPEYPKEEGQFKNIRLLGAMVKWASRDDTLLPFIIGRENILRQDFLAFRMGMVSTLITEDANILKMKIYIRYGRGKGILGIYSHDESTGRPGVLLAEKDLQFPGEVSNYWQEISFQKEFFLTKGSTIWLTWVFENMTILSSESDTLLQKGDFGESDFLEYGLTWKDLTKMSTTLDENSEAHVSVQTHLPSVLPEAIFDERRIITCYVLGQFLNQTNMASVSEVSTKTEYLP